MLNLTRPFILFTICFVAALTFPLWHQSFNKHFTSFADAADNTIYDDNLAVGWENWSWGTRVNFQATNTAYSGNRSIEFAPMAWGGFYLHNEKAIETKTFTSLRFALKGSRSDQKIKVLAYDQNNQPLGQGLPLEKYGGNLEVGNWKVYNIPLSELTNNASYLKGFALQEVSGQNQLPLYIDGVQLVSPIVSSPTTTLAPTISTATLYGDSLTNGWLNWSWNSQVDFNQGSTVNSGSKAIAFRPWGQWAGFYLHSDAGLNTSGYNLLNFALRASQDGQKFALLLYDGNNQLVSIKLLKDLSGDPLPTAWKQYQAPLDQLGAANKVIKGIAIQDVGSVQNYLFIDDVKLTGGNANNSPSTITPTSVNNQPLSTPTPTQTPNNPPQTSTGGSGYTVGNGQIYKNGQKINLYGVNWFGFETETYAPHGLWARGYKEMIGQMKQLGFNSVRIPFCPGTLQNKPVTGVDYAKNQDLKGLNSLGVMDKLMTEFANQQMYVLLDHHRPDCQAISDLWYTGSYSESQWINDLKFIATRYKDNPYFMGLDLKNEPHGSATWGTGNQGTDWNKAAERAGREVLTVNQNVLIFVEGVGDNPTCSDNNAHFWGGNLSPFKCQGISQEAIPTNKLVLSPHVYGPDVHFQNYFGDANFPNNMPGIWDSQFGFLANQGYVLVPGEWGGKYGNGGDPKDKIWQDALVRYLTEKKICNSYYWDWNPNSGDTGGVLQDDWSTPWSNKVSMLQNYFNQCK